MITVIIPTYKRPEMLRIAIESVRAQTYQALKICIYDNASDDGTEAVVRSLMAIDPRIHYHCHEKNLGMIGNYQFALERVDTPYFSILSDDDSLLPDFFEIALEGFSRYPAIYFSAASTVIKTTEGKVKREPLALWSREGYFAPREGALEMIDRYPVPTTVLFRREVLDRVSIDWSNALLWDVDFLLHIALSFPIYVTKQRGGVFLCHHASYSREQGWDGWVDGYKRLIQRMNTDREIVKKLEGSLHAVLLRIFGMLLIQRRDQEAHKRLSEYRKDWGWNRTAACMWAGFWGCRLFYPARLLLTFASKA
ncbi:MAG: glycosyltransferase family 2 protein [Verrucomicrobia bacterium]|nr:glycosyltransferase family 2 protein [Verrucomicrobiota bacterium]